MKRPPHHPTRIEDLKPDEKQLEFLLRKTREQLKLEHMESEINRDRAEVAETYLDNIVKHISEHFYWMDRNGIMLGCNEEQATNFGLKSAQELIGKNIYDYLYSLDWNERIVEEIRANNIYVMQTEKTLKKEETAIINGEPRIYISSKNPLRNKQGEVIGVFGFSIDITDRKKAEQGLIEAKEEAERASRAKTEFIENMRHDLRTPFSAVIGLAQGLIANETDQNKKEALEWIEKTSHVVLNVLNDILAGATADQVRTLIDFDLFSIRKLINDLNDLFTAEVNLKKLSFEVNIDDNVPDVLVGDKLHVQRILLNLLSNAVKFTDIGKVQLNISVHDFERNHLMLNISIKDTGIGIPEEKIRSIFEKFTKLKPSFLSNRYMGVGVGLSIVQKLIRELNGSIDVESKEGNGTTFTCLIPFDVPDQPNQD